MRVEVCFEIAAGVGFGHREEAVVEPHLGVNRVSGAHPVNRAFDFASGIRSAALAKSKARFTGTLRPAFGPPLLLSRSAVQRSSTILPAVSFTTSSHLIMKAYLSRTSPPGRRRKYFGGGFSMKSSCSM